MHGGYGLPSVPPDVQPFATRHAHGTVVSTHAVQHVVKRSHGAAAASAAHGGYGHPFAHPRIESFHGRLVIGRVEASQGVQAVVCYACDKIEPLPGQGVLIDASTT